MFSKIRFNAFTLLFAGLAFAVFSGTAGAAPKVYVGNFKDNTVSAIDAATGKTVATIPVASGPHGMTITRDGRWIFVSGDSSSQVSVIDTTKDSVAQTIDVGKGPHGSALTPDGRQLLVAVNGEDRVVFVDTKKLTVAGSVEVAKPHTVAIRADGKVAYVTSQLPGKFALVVVDLAKRAVVRAVALDKPPRDVEFGYGGKALYFTVAGLSAVEVLDPKTDKVVAEIPTGASPHYANLFAGTKLGMAVVQGPGELLLFDPATNKPVGKIAVGKQPHWMTVSSDGKTAFVTNEGSNDLSVVNLITQKVEIISVGNAPRKVVVQAGPIKQAGSVSITNFAFAPGAITITAGESVTWTNDDGAPHTVTFKDRSQSSDSLSPGNRFTRVFDQPGTYEYFCTFHEFMTGRVIVQAKTAAKEARMN
jgi:YVTN family beta-propeller protein